MSTKKKEILPQLVSQHEAAKIIGIPDAKAGGMLMGSGAQHAKVGPTWVFVKSEVESFAEKFNGSKNENDSQRQA